MVQATSPSETGTDRCSEIRLNRIRCLSRIMAIICLAASVLLTLAMAIYWATTPTHQLFSHAGLPNVPTRDIDPLGRVLAMGIAIVPLGALIYGLHSARRCFEAFARGQVFTGEPIRQLKRFAIAIAASALLKPFTGAALSVLLSWRGSTSAKTLAFHVGSDTLIALIFAGTVAIIAWVMTEALAIARENQQFV